MPKTRKKPWWSGWRGKSPNKKQRRATRKRCGKKCFLGPNLSFPVCAKGTCRINKRGVMSAYIRAKQWGKPRSFYKNYWGKPHMKRKVYTRVAKKARKLMGWKKGGRRRRTRRRTRKKRGGQYAGFNVGDRVILSQTGIVNAMRAVQPNSCLYPSLMYPDVRNNARNWTGIVRRAQAGTHNDPFRGKIRVKWNFHLPHVQGRLNIPYKDYKDGVLAILDLTGTDIGPDRGGPISDIRLRYAPERVQEAGINSNQPGGRRRRTRKKRGGMNPSENAGAPKKIKKHTLKLKKYKIQKMAPKKYKTFEDYLHSVGAMSLNEWMKLKPIPYENDETVENTDFFN